MFLEECFVGEGQELKDKSGSTAITVLIVGSACYIANVGDSRALLSSHKGMRIYSLSKDHKPQCPKEKDRILAANGQIYHRTAITPTDRQAPDVVVGPMRVLPGRLSVTRTFGDFEAKLPCRGGNPRVVIPIPEIKTFEVTGDHDFIVIGCDGIFDKMNNADTVKSVWKSVKDLQNLSIHEQCCEAVDYVIKNSLLRKTQDNVTSLVIAFDGLT